MPFILANQRRDTAPLNGLILVLDYTQTKTLGNCLPIR
jgi:hypothetical protein